jgi:hypothetical protein
MRSTVSPAHSPSARRAGLMRSRWTAVGAAVVISVGGGGFPVADAASPADGQLATVTVAPCRLIDTRDGGSPLTAITTVTFTARGACAVPAGAAAIVANVTVSDPTQAGYLTVFPAGIARPATSTVNWQADTVAMANQATVGLSASGQFSMFINAGVADVVVDVSGYLVPSAGGPAGVKGDTGAAGADGIDGLAGEQGEQGIQGIQGIQGEIGPDGEQGIQGIQGEIGPDGDQGPAGPGVVYTSGFASSSQTSLTGFGTSNVGLMVDCSNALSPSETDIRVYVRNGGITVAHALMDDDSTSTLMLGDNANVLILGPSSTAQLATVRVTVEVDGTIYEGTVFVETFPAVGICQTFSAVETIGQIGIGV